MRDRLKQKEDYTYTYDNSTTEECNELIESFEKSPAIRFLWTNIKPLIRGKILFTPNTPATRYSSMSLRVLVIVLCLRMIIQQVNSTFQSMETAKNLMTDWNERISRRLRDVLLDEGNQQFLKEFFTSNEGTILEVLGKFEILSLSQ